MKATDLLDLLREFHRDKLALYRRHVAVARHISHYDFNNTYQYLIARDDMHVAWLRDAILDMHGTLDDVPEPAVRSDGKGDAAQSVLLGEDRDAAQAFVDKWRPRIEDVTNARHRNLLRVILGEMLEQKRFFEQAVAGRSDLLGRRADGAGTGGGVMSTRWVQ